jgi:nucleotide-binding universal stress UspA family protein
MVRVLVAVDDSDTSVRAAETARKLFGADAEYLALNVGQVPLSQASLAGGVAAPTTWGAVWPMWPVGGDPYPVNRQLGNEMPVGPEVSAQEASRVAEAAGIRDAQAIGDVGDPVEAIVAAADRHGVDVVVVGHTERSWFTRLLTTPTSQEVLKATNRPVLVVR